MTKVSERIGKMISEGKLIAGFNRMQLAKELKVKKHQVYDALCSLRKNGIPIPGDDGPQKKGKKRKLTPILEEGIELNTLGTVTVYRITGSPKVVAQLLKEMEDK